MANVPNGSKSRSRSKIRTPRAGSECRGPSPLVLSVLTPCLRVSVVKIPFGTFGLAVADEGLHFLRRGREAGEVVGDAADEGAGVGGRVGLEALCFQLRQDEGVDRAADPGLVLDLRRGGTADGLEGPEGTVLVLNSLHNFGRLAG